MSGTIFVSFVFVSWLKYWRRVKSTCRQKLFHVCVNIPMSDTEFCAPLCVFKQCRLRSLIRHFVVKINSAILSLILCKSKGNSYCFIDASATNELQNIKLKKYCVRLHKSQIVWTFFTSPALALSSLLVVKSQYQSKFTNRRSSRNVSSDNIRKVTEVRSNKTFARIS